VVDHIRVDHSYQQFLHRPVAQPVDDALDRDRGNMTGSFRRMVDIRPVIDGVLQITLLFKPVKNRSNGGLLRPRVFRETMDRVRNYRYSL